MRRLSLVEEPNSKRGWWKFLMTGVCGSRVVGDRASKKSPELSRVLAEIIEPEIGGDPEGRARYVRSSLRSLAQRIKTSANTVGRLLRGMKFSLRANRKRLSGAPHPDRDQQYQQIQNTKADFHASGDPVLSIDAKNRQLIGDFKNNGKTWRAAPEDVNMYDFPSDSQGKATPFGVFDRVANHCLVMVCLSSATAAFAVNSIRVWWQKYGHQRYANAKRLLIECDGGGCNGHRPRLWKWQLQELADELGISITVRHYSRGASKWNPIEHRVFGRISQNWAGYPLRTLTRILGFIRGTTTTQGLKVDAEYDPQTYETGLKISDAQMKTIHITRETNCPDWNYTIHPRIRN